MYALNKIFSQFCIPTNIQVRNCLCTYQEHRRFHVPSLFNHAILVGSSAPAAALVKCNSRRCIILISILLCWLQVYVYNMHVHTSKYLSLYYLFLNPFVE